MSRVRKRDLNPNLTFEEFEALANRKPKLEGYWLYKVTQAIYDNELKYPYPKFELNYTRESYFRTFESAESFVRMNKGDVYCSWIKQIPFGVDYDKSGVEWLYNGKGELLDYSITQGCYGNIEDQTFFGRPISRQRFKEGDIVEVVTEKEVSLAVLCHSIPDVQLCWKIYQNCQKDKFPYFLDFTDDSATVIDGPNYSYHSHVPALQLMKPRFPIPDDILREMGTWYERCENTPESEWINENDSYQIECRKEKGERLGEFYELNIYLHFDDPNTPHLHINDLYGMRVSLRIERPEYYDHDGYNGRLTISQLESLYNYLECPDNGKPKWWYMIREWNENNEDPQRIIPLSTPLPDYRVLSNKY